MADSGAGEDWYPNPPPECHLAEGYAVAAGSATNAAATIEVIATATCREYARTHGVDEDTVITVGMADQAPQFRDHGGSIYVEE